MGPYVMDSHSDSYWYARVVLQHGTGSLYLVALLVALHQFRPLLGEHGLLPVPDFVRRVNSALSSRIVA